MTSPRDSYLVGLIGEGIMASLTPPIGTVFLEVVERRHGYDGYGALNAPVRLAAQYQQRRQAKTGASA